MKIANNIFVISFLFVFTFSSSFIFLFLFVLFFPSFLSFSDVLMDFSFSYVLLTAMANCFFILFLFSPFFFYFLLFIFFLLLFSPLLSYLVGQTTMATALPFLFFNFCRYFPLNILFPFAPPFSHVPQRTFLAEDLVGSSLSLFFFIIISFFFYLFNFFLLFVSPPRSAGKSSLPWPML